MTTNKHLEARETATLFARDNLRQCAAEILEMKDSGVLRDGKVRELSTICMGFTGTASSALSVALTLVNTAALEVAASGLKLH